MSYLIEVLRQEHCNIERLLCVLERELTVFDRGDRPNYEIVLAVIDYFKDYAERVMIVEVCENGTEAQFLQHMNDLASYLLHHKVIVAEKAYLHTEQPVANELLRFAKDENADLIVAGGYGHSRLGEWMFGGVTRGLLRDSPICSLFSH